MAKSFYTRGIFLLRKCLSIVLFAISFSIFIGTSAFAFSMQTGYYVGTGFSRSITGTGFQPDLVIIKADTASGRAVWKSSAMAGDSTAYFENAVPNDTGLITSLDTDGFSLGTNANVNTANVRYTWVAFYDSGGGAFKVGSYTGDGTDNRNITVEGFQPSLVWLKGNSASYGVWNSSAMGGDRSQYFSATAPASNLIQALQPDGFQIGTGVNAAPYTYFYVAFSSEAANMAVGSYEGNGTDDRSITGVGFKPDFMFLKHSSAINAAVLRNDQNYGDESQLFTATANATNQVQALENDSFQVGTNSRVNSLEAVYYYAAFKGVPSPEISGVFKMLSGSYTGNGSSKSITGLGFKPDLVIIKADTAAGSAVFTTPLMAPDSTAYMAVTTANFAGGITSLDNDGFSLGTSAMVNTLETPYRWVAFKGANSTNFAIGAYTGTNADDRSLGCLSFQPDLVVIKGTGATYSVFRTSSMSGDVTNFFSASAESANIIQTLEANGFQVGTNPVVNGGIGTTTYFYFAFKNTSGQFKAFDYTGDGLDNRSITGVGFRPGFVWIKRPDVTSGAVHRPASFIGDNTQYFTATANIANAIQALESDGFQVGTSTAVNTNAITYRYSAWKITSTTASNITFEVQPPDAVAGACISPAPQVAIKDQYGNTVITDNTSLVTIEIQDNPGGASLTGTKTRVVSSGVAIFDNLVINNSGAGYTLQAQTYGFPSTVSASFDVTGSMPAPQVIFFSPTSEAANVTPEAIVSAEFSIAMDTGSVQNAFTLKAVMDSSGNSINIPIGGSFSWIGNRVLFTPSVPLTRGYTYRTDISTEASDTFGNHLQAAQPWDFRIISDSAAANVFIAGDGKTKAAFPSGALSGSFSVQFSTDPQSSPIAVDPAKISAADAKIASLGEPLFHPVAGTYREFAAYDITGEAITNNFLKKVTIYLPYTDNNDDGIVDGTIPPVSIHNLVIYWLDESSSTWLKAPGSVLVSNQKCLTAPVTHFSTYVIMSTPVLGVSRSHPYPNPFVPSEGHTTVTFTNLPSSCTIKIFTVSGELVKTIQENSGSGQNIWDVENDSNESLRSGVYLYVVKSSSDTKTGKLVVIR
jgi:hypothetical protein